MKVNYVVCDPKGQLLGLGWSSFGQILAEMQASSPASDRFCRTLKSTQLIYQPDASLCTWSQSAEIMLSIAGCLAFTVGGSPIWSVAAKEVAVTDIN